MKLSEASSAYCRDVILFRNQSKKTEENHRIAMASLIRFVGDIDCASLSFEQVRRWKEDLEKGRSDATVRNYIIKLRVVLLYLKTRGINCLDPDRVPVPKAVDKVPAFLTKEEVSKLIYVLEEGQEAYAKINRYRNQAIISLLYASGIRLSELCALDKGDLKDGVFTVVGKGKKPRICFYDQRTGFLLGRYLTLRKDNCKALFVANQTKCRIAPSNVQLMFRNVARKAGFVDKKIHPHILRHSFATNLLQENTNLRYVQEFLGHASIQTTQLYSHVVNKDLQQIYREKHTI